MYTSIIAVVTLGLASSVSATLYGGQCNDDGLDHCLYDNGAWGCVQIQGGGPNCVDQTQVCDAACGFSGYAYQKNSSPDRRCVCSYEDASQSRGGFWNKREVEFQG